MSLITCSECGKTVSDKAERCMHCGMPVAEILNAHGKGSHETVSTFLGGRLTIGILSLLWSIILFADLMYCYYLERNYSFFSFDSESEFFCIVHLLCFFIAGLAHICTCNSVKSTGCEIAVMAYGMATLSALDSGHVLYILICGCLCLVNLYFLSKLPDPRRKGDKKDFYETKCKFDAGDAQSKK